MEINEDAYADWQYEVMNGDTLQGFQDWVESQEAANS